MTYQIRLGLLVILDSIIVSTAIFMASWIVYPFMATYDVKVIIISSTALLLFHHLYAMLYDMYNKVWSYASVGELSAIARAVTLSILSTGLIQLLINDLTIYRRGLLVTWMLHIILIEIGRASCRV